MMMKSLSIIFLSFITLTANAITYYKWVDTNGVPHYSDTAPTNGVNLNKVEVINSRNFAAPTPYAPTTVATPTTNNANTTAQTPEQKRIAELEAQKKADDQSRCKSLQDSLKNLDMGGRAYEIDDKGQRKYLDNREVELKRQTVQQAINQYCK